VRFLFPVYFINHAIVSDGTASTAQEQCQAILGGLHFLPHTESHNWGRFKRLSAEEIEEEHKGAHEDLLACLYLIFPNKQTKQHSKLPRELPHYVDMPRIVASWIPPNTYKHLLIRTSTRECMRLNSFPLHLFMYKYCLCNREERSLSSSSHRREEGGEKNEGPTQKCRYGGLCRDFLDQNHCRVYSHPGPCRYGANCRKTTEQDHLRDYYHPQPSLVDSKKRKADKPAIHSRGRESSPSRPCRYGAGCRKQDDAEHCRAFSHRTYTPPSPSTTTQSSHSLLF